LVFTNKPRFIRERKAARWWLTGAGIAALAVTALATEVHGVEVPSVRPAAVTQAVNPLWEQANAFAFGGKHEQSDVWRTHPKAAGTTKDDGIVFFRVFIPHAFAAGAMLLGDDRGFSADPTAKSRGVVVWNTSNGDVSVVVSHSVHINTAPDWSSYAGISMPALYTFESMAALPLTPGTDWNAAFAARDSVRSDNRVGIHDDSKSTGMLKARVSLLNPLTNGSGPPAFGLGAWSVDQEFAITRTDDGLYRLQLTGNGYPAIEAYFYPKYAPSPDARSQVIAKRKVAPLFQGQPLDAGGGVAARDWESWNECSYRTPTSFECRNTAPYSHHKDAPFFNYLPWAEPSEQDWKKPWSTESSAVAAL
jgi:hypothetical protein